MKFYDKYLFVQFVLVLTGIACAADQEPLVEQFNSKFKRGYFDLGAMFQYELDWQPRRTMPGHSGFSVANARLKVSGRLDNGFGYLLQANFANVQGLLDAAIRYKLNQYIAFDIGQFKSPFSREYLLSPAVIDFVNRSRVADVLAPKRQIGVQLKTTIPSVPVNINVGIFNGNGFSQNSNDNEHYLVAARANYVAVSSELSHLEIGINGANSRDSTVRIGQELNPFVYEPLFFTGQRTLWGADFTYRYQNFMLTGEYIHGMFNGTFRQSNSDTPFGSREPSG